MPSACLPLLIVVVFFCLIRYVSQCLPIYPPSLPPSNPATHTHHTTHAASTPQALPRRPHPRLSEPVLPECLPVAARPRQGTSPPSFPPSPSSLLRFPQCTTHTLQASAHLPLPVHFPRTPFCSLRLRSLPPSHSHPPSPSSTSPDDTPVIDVAIVGGGIGGLATALALQTLAPHLSFRLYERSPTLRGGEGTALTMWPNGLSALGTIDAKLLKRVGR